MGHPSFFQQIFVACIVLALGLLQWARRANSPARWSLYSVLSAGGGRQPAPTVTSKWYTFYREKCQEEYKAGWQMETACGTLKKWEWSRDLTRGKEPAVRIPGKEHVTRDEAQPNQAGPGRATWHKPGQSGTFYVRPKREALSSGLWRACQNSPSLTEGKVSSMVRENEAKKSETWMQSHLKPDPPWGRHGGAPPQKLLRGRTLFLICGKHVVTV